MTRPVSPVARMLWQFRGKPCWRVQEGHGSCLTLEFGQPILTTMKPRPVTPEMSPRVRRHLSRPQAFVHGEWHLWVWDCDWTIHQNRKRLASNGSRSSSTIVRAGKELQGQSIVDVVIDATRGRTRFEFDYGGRLETRRRNRGGEQWLLFDPREHVLTVRADGRYSHVHRSSSINHEKWTPLP